MLIGVGIGPGDPELLTVKAVRILKEANEVIAPGELAADIIEEIRKPRIVEFPMGKSEKVIEELSQELAKRCVEEDIAFVALGDIMFYSTFMHVASRVMEINPDVEVECIPGIPSFSCVFDKTKIFCNKPFIVLTAKDIELINKGKSFEDILERIVVLKASHSIGLKGFKLKAVAKRMYMDGEDVRVVRADNNFPEFDDYFTVAIFEKEKSNESIVMNQ